MDAGEVSAVELVAALLVEGAELVALVREPVGEAAVIFSNIRLILSWRSWSESSETGNVAASASSGAGGNRDGSHCRRGFGFD